MRNQFAERGAHFAAFGLLLPSLVALDGDVTVDDDSSGSILVQDLGGNFTVGSDGSGSIRYEPVTGSVRIPE